MKSVAIITGASSGLGRALAPLLARQNYHVALVGRDPGRLEEVILSAPTTLQPRMKSVAADLSLDKQVATVVERCQAQFGKETTIDLLVNNAGASVTGRMEDIPTADYERCWRLNYWACVLLVGQVLPLMKQRKKGTIANVISGVAHRALPYESAYCAAKAALKALTESLMLEAEPFGIDVLLFSPGPISSEFLSHRQHFGNTRIVHPPRAARTPEVVAWKLHRAITRRKRRTVIGVSAKVFAFLNLLCPWLVDRILSKMYRIQLSR